MTWALTSKQWNLIGSTTVVHLRWVHFNCSRDTRRLFTLEKVQCRLHATVVDFGPQAHEEWIVLWYVTIWKRYTYTRNVYSLQTKSSWASHSRRLTLGWILAWAQTLHIVPKLKKSKCIARAPPFRLNTMCQLPLESFLTELVLHKNHRFRKRLNKKMSFFSWHVTDNVHDKSPFLSINYCFASPTRFASFLIIPRGSVSIAIPKAYLWEKNFGWWRSEPSGQHLSSHSFNCNLYSSGAGLSPPERA